MIDFKSCGCCRVDKRMRVIKRGEIFLYWCILLVLNIIESEVVFKEIEGREDL